jgi:phosphatidylglycerophosphate synthase
MPTPPQTPDRRPIAARERRWSQRLAAALIARRVSPNAISMGGMAAGIGAGAVLGATPNAGPIAVRLLFLAAAGLIQLRLLANMLDGMVAIGSGRASPVGELYNEIPDRISDCCTLAGLGYAAGGSPALGYTAAALAILTAYIRSVGKAAGAGNDFRGPMAKPHRMFVATLACLACAAVPAPWRQWGSGGPVAGIPAAALWVIAIGSGITCVRRLRRIAIALRRSAGP